MVLADILYFIRACRRIASGCITINDYDDSYGAAPGTAGWDTFCLFILIRPYYIENSTCKLPTSANSPARR